MEMTNNLIRITTLPEIQERLQSLKERWEQKAKDAESMAATEETIQDIKKARAEMRKEFDEAETQRKATKAQYMAPWDKVEDLYSDCVKSAYTRADAAYKAKIDNVEGEQKRQCEERCRAYFDEMRAVHGLDWLKYEQAGVKITLSEAKKKTPVGCFQQISDFTSRVACDIDAIASDPESAAEIMTEYKSNGLNLAKAQKTIRDRREAQEAERKAAEERAEAKRREAEAVAKVEAAAPAVVSPPVVVETPAPVVEKLLTVAFKATATREKLIRLREWMKAEGIKYE